MDITLFLHALRYFSLEILGKAPPTRFPHCGTKGREGDDDADNSKKGGRATAAMTTVIGKKIDSDVDNIGDRGDSDVDYSKARERWRRQGGTLRLWIDICPIVPVRSHQIRLLRFNNWRYGRCDPARKLIWSTTWYWKWCWRWSA